MLSPWKRCELNSPSPCPAHEPPKHDIHNSLYPSMLRRMAVFDHSARFRGAKRVKMSGDSLPGGEGEESAVLCASVAPRHSQRRGRNPLIRGENSPNEFALCAPEPGRDAFHRVPKFRQVWGCGGTRPYHPEEVQGQCRVRGNGCREPEMGSVKFHAAPNPGSGSGVLCLQPPAGSTPVRKYVVRMVYLWRMDVVRMWYVWGTHGVRIVYD